MKFLYAISILLLVGCTNTTNTKEDNIDRRLVGNWVGERSNVPTPNCQYVSWSSQRNVNGTYDITFYSDSSRQKEIFRESGKWWSKNGTFYSIAPTLMKVPDSYSYSVEENGAVISFNSLTQDQSGDCQEAYKFKDKRS